MLPSSKSFKATLESISVSVEMTAFLNCKVLKCKFVKVRIIPDAASIDEELPYSNSFGKMFACHASIKLSSLDGKVSAECLVDAMAHTQHNLFATGQFLFPECSTDSLKVCILFCPHVSARPASRDRSFKIWPPKADWIPRLLSSACTTL